MATAGVVRQLASSALKPTELAASNKKIAEMGASPEWHLNIRN
jgi:hypothetical protein